MGKGDKRTRKGKTFKGSHGVTRPKKGQSIAQSKKKTPAKKGAK